MKTMKKLFALLLALTMVFGLAATGFAAAEDGTDTAKITITSAKKGETYNVYRVFDLSYNEDADTENEGEEGKGFVYTLRKDAESDSQKEGYPYSNVWATEFFDYEYTVLDADGEETSTVLKVADYLSCDEETKIVTWIKEEDDHTASARELAQLIAAFVAENKIEADNTEECTDTSASVEFENLPLGYYFVTTTTGSLCSLDTNNKDVEIGDKNLVPEVDKKQQEDQNGSYTDKTNTGDIGDTVNYEVEITIQPGVVNFIWHDDMFDALTSKDDVKLYTKRTCGDNDKLDEKYYTVHYLSKATDGTGDNEGKKVDGDYVFKSNDNDIEVEFDQDWLNAIKWDEPMTIYARYSAVINENAVDAEGSFDSITNRSQVTWGNDQGSEWVQVKSKTFELSVLKVDADDNKVLLSGAEFELYRAGDEGDISETLVNLVAYGDSTDSTLEDGDVYLVCDNAKCDHEEGDHITTVTTPEDTAKFYIYGLDAGIYYLKETKAPKGYNLLKYPIKVEISYTPADSTSVPTVEEKIEYKYWLADSEGKYSEGDGRTISCFNNDYNLTVENGTGTELPSTGGMGTTLFYVVGSLMVLGAAVLLVAKKRSNT